MRILFLSAACSSHTVKWVNTLAQRGHQVLLATQVDHRARADAVSPLVRVEYLMRSGTAGYYFNAAQLRELAAATQPQVVSAHYASGYGTLARRAKLYPVLLSVWGSDIFDFPTKSGLHRRLTEKNLSHAVAIASTSRVMAEETRHYLKAETPIFITPFGIDIKLFAPQVRKNDGTFVVGVMKRLEPECGVEVLIQAFKLLRSRVRLENPGKRVLLRIYGQGSEYAPLLGLARHILVAEDTEFFGQIANSDMPNALAQMDVVCLPSLRESFGVAAVEAMASARALVTSDAAGFLETVEDSVTGIIVRDMDEKKLADALYALYKDPLLCRAMGNEGRKRAERLYSMERCAAEMERALEFAARSKKT